MDRMIEALVYRYDPGEDERPRYEKYAVPHRENMTVLEVLKFIYDHYTPLAFRYGCRIKTCGSCAVMMNNRPVLACKEKAQSPMTIEPLPTLPVIRDLVVDFDAYTEERLKFRPFVDRPGGPPDMPRDLSYETVYRYRVCEICIKCLICDAVCPVVRQSPHLFSGPSIMVEQAKFLRDPQDEGDRVRLALSGGLMNCDLCGDCSEACPANIAIHEIIRELQELGSSMLKPQP